MTRNERLSRQVIKVHVPLKDRRGIIEKVSLFLPSYSNGRWHEWFVLINCRHKTRVWTKEEDKIRLSISCVCHLVDGDHYSNSLRRNDQETESMWETGSYSQSWDIDDEGILDTASDDMQCLSNSGCSRLSNKRIPDENEESNVASERHTLSIFSVDWKVYFTAAVSERKYFLSKRRSRLDCRQKEEEETRQDSTNRQTEG